jgi:metal-sulfur cluster biosynthetic enzyme
MTDNITKEDILQAIHKVGHPEISATLFELGMIRDVDVSPDSRQVSVTLVLPMLGIPEEIRRYLASSLTQAAQAMGAKLSYKVAEMSSEERRSFMEKAQRLWRG